MNLPYTSPSPSFTSSWKYFPSSSSISPIIDIPDQPANTPIIPHATQIIPPDPLIPPNSLHHLELL